MVPTLTFLVESASTLLAVQRTAYDPLQTLNALFIQQSSWGVNNSSIPVALGVILNSTWASRRGPQGSRGLLACEPRAYLWVLYLTWAVSSSYIHTSNSSVRGEGSCRVWSTPTLSKRDAGASPVWSGVLRRAPQRTDNATTLAGRVKVLLYGNEKEAWHPKLLPIGYRSGKYNLSHRL